MFRPAKDGGSADPRFICENSTSTNVTSSVVTYTGSGNYSCLDMYSSGDKKENKITWSLNSGNATYKNSAKVTPQSVATKFYIKF